MSDKIIRDVFKTISKFKMIEKGDGLLVSISGGPDSVFLTHILTILKNKQDLKLSCFHLDHKTRDGESKKDAEFVAKFCKDRGIKIYREEIDCEKWCKAKSLTFQEGARILRLTFLNKIAAENRIQRIATGHTADDSIETFFLHLFRGSGLGGLKGIEPVEGNFIRPLINTRRKDISDYLDKSGIPYCIDRTNLENKYERNKVRNQLIPFIKKNFSSSFDKRLLKTIDIIREEDRFISNFARQKLKGIAEFGLDTSGKNLQFIKIPVDKLNYFPDSLKKRVFIEAIKAFKGSSENIKRINLEDLLELCFSGGEKKEVALAGGLLFLKEPAELIFKNTGYDIEASPGYWEYRLTIGKEQVFEKEGIGITSVVIEGGMDRIKKPEIRDSEAYMDFDKIRFPVYARSWKRDSGEKFLPLGSKGFRKLHDFFIDKKIPYSKRASIPVFTDSEKIIWIGGLRLDERVKLDKNTRKILYIKIFDI